MSLRGSIDRAAGTTYKLACVAFCLSLYFTCHPDCACPSFNNHCRFTYGTSCVRPSNCWNALTKLDTVTGEVR